MNTIILENSDGKPTVILEQDNLLKHVWFVQSVQRIDGLTNSIPTPFRYGFNSIEVRDTELLVNTYHVKNNVLTSIRVCHFKKIGEGIYKDDYEQKESFVEIEIDSSKERT